MKRLNLTKDVMGVSEFRASMSENIERVEQERNPLVLTRAGRPSVVMLDVKSYQEMVDLLEQTSERALVEGIQRAEEDIEEGRFSSHEDAMKEFKKRRKNHNK